MSKPLSRRWRPQCSRPCTGKGLGSFTLPGLLKANVIKVPAKKTRTGIDPFPKMERAFAAKPATVKIKTRVLKKLKDAAL